MEKRSRHRHQLNVTEKNENQRESSEYSSFYWCTANATFHSKQITIVSISMKENKCDYDLSSQCNFRQSTAQLNFDPPMNQWVMEQCFDFVLTTLQLDIGTLDPEVNQERISFFFSREIHFRNYSKGFFEKFRNLSIKIEI